VRYYSEASTRNFRIAFEAEVLGWPKVNTKQMFGCPCYQVRGRLFVLLVTRGIVITRLGTRDRERLCREHRARSFDAGKKIIPQWVRIPTVNGADVDRLIPFVKRSYEAGRRRP
jgi:hypothetical protein